MLLGGLTAVSSLESTCRPADAASIEVPVAARQCAKYDTVEIPLAIEANVTNPYDPADIAVDAVFTSPSGRTITVPGFLCQSFDRALQGDEEVLTSRGSPDWRVRFTPAEEGRYEFSVRLSGKSGQAEWSGGVLDVSPSADPGFVRISATNPRYLAFDDGTPYFAIGHNVCWPNASRTYDYEDYFARMAEAGENYTRLWLGPGWSPFSIQRYAPPEAGLTHFDQRSAWRLDYVLDLAKRYGIRVMLCLESFNYLRRIDPYPSWDLTPYRADAGGPISEPGEFFTNEDARRWFKARMRYLVARHGHHTAVLSWEFWNEVDLCEGYGSETVAAWHREMATYLRELDPYDHLITTSYAYAYGDPAVDGLPELDYVQTHSYGSRDIAAMAVFFAQKKHGDYGRPHMIGEFGAGAMAEFLTADREGYHLHEGIWASAMSGDFGCAALWWWDNYIRPLDLYYHFAALSRFLEDAPITDPEFGPLELNAPVFEAPVELPRQTIDLCGEAPFDSGGALDIDLPSDGSPPRAATFPRFLHGTVNHPELHNPLTFRVSSPVPWTFAVQVEGVSGWGGACLRVSLDGDERVLADMPDEAPDSHETMSQFDGKYEVEVPAGDHVLRVENTGRDWLIFRLLFQEYASVQSRPLLVCAVGSAECAYVWVRHLLASWHNLVADQETPTPIPESRLLVTGLRPGAYRVEAFDTWKGVVTDAIEAEATDEGLWLTLPEVRIDVAVRVRRLG